MKHIYLIFLVCLASGTNCFGQLQEIPLCGETDSTFMQVYDVKFDDAGHFLYDKTINDTTYLFQNGNIKIAANPYSYGKMVECHDYTESHMHYYIDDLHFIYGPTSGKVLSSVTTSKAGRGMHELVSIHEGSKVNLYYDGKLYKSIDTTRKSPDDDYVTALFNWDWAALSNSGNILINGSSYTVDSLFLNGRLIDTCEHAITKLAVNNHGNYTYVKVYKKPVEGKIKYINIFHSKDTTIYLGEHFPSTWHLFSHDGYYYFDYPGRSKFQLVNNQLYQLNGAIENVFIRDKVNHYFILNTPGEDKDRYFIASNGVVYPLDYDQIYFPSIDEKGNVALVGKRNYYLYRWVNGQEISEPVTRFGVRPQILHVSSSGDVIAAFKTVNDSTFIYKNDLLLFSGKTKEITFADRIHTVLESREHAINYGEQNWVYLNIRDSCYILWNGKLSPALTYFQNYFGYSNENKDNQIAAFERNENGYMLVIRRPGNNYELIVNNRPMGKFTANRIFRTAYFNNEYLTFYGVKDLSLFQFKLLKP